MVKKQLNAYKIPVMDWEYFEKERVHKDLGTLHKDKN